MTDRKAPLNFKFSTQRVDTVYNIRKEPKSIIGKGNFGIVVKAEDKITGQVRAIKIINKTKLLEHDSEMETLTNEFNIMMTVDHPNIVRLYEVYEDQKYIYFVMEYLRGLTLYQLLTSQDYHLTESEIRYLFFQLTKGVQYLHKNGIAHRDLKPENIIFISPKSKELKIIDFGVSKYFISKEGSEKQITLRTQTGSLYYISPEIIEGSYDERCDIWSAGVILYSLFTCIPPFWDMNPDNVIRKIQKYEFDFKHDVWRDVSPNAVDLIKRLLVPKNTRLSTDGILAHPWMKEELADKIQTKTPIGIKKFFFGKALSRFVMQIITACSSETDNQALGELFVRIDQDGDGVISRESLLEGIQTHCKIYDKELSDLIMKRFAPDEKIYYKNFLAAVNALQGYSDFEKRVEKAFSMIDVNARGKIRADDLELAFKRMNLGLPAEFKSWGEMVKDVDQNQKGYLELSDFKAMMSYYVEQ
jgi:calcium-dependent protein kinase